MSLTLYTISGAPCPWRVLVAMAIKGINHDVRFLSGADKEHKKEAYLQLNPRGTMPTLVSDLLVIRDSIAILAWLDRAYPEVPLFGESAAEAAYIWQNTMELVEFLPPATSGVLAPIFFENAAEVTPDLSRAAETLREELVFVDRLLDKGMFLSGARAGGADAVAYPHVRLIRRAMDTRPGIMAGLGLSDYAVFSANISAWLKRMEVLPGMAATYPPHWAAAA